MAYGLWIDKRGVLSIAPQRGDLEGFGNVTARRQFLATTQACRHVDRCIPHIVWAEIDRYLPRDVAAWAVIGNDDARTLLDGDCVESAGRATDEERMRWRPAPATDEEILPAGVR